MRFRATIQLGGKTASGIRVPAEVVASLGASKRPPVRVTINGHTYRSTVAPMGGVSMLGVSAENREAAGVQAGDEVDVDVELDTEPRKVTVPADFADALDRVPDARRFSTGCPTATSSDTCSRSSRPRQPRHGSDGSPRRSARCKRAESKG